MVNKTFLVGKLVGDPEISTLANGTPRGKFALKTWYYIKKEDENEENIKITEQGEIVEEQSLYKKIPTKHKIECYGKYLVDKIKKYEPGDILFVEGSIVRYVVDKEVGDEIIKFPIVTVKAERIKRIVKNIFE